MGDEAFQTKKNEPTHISLRCLEQAVCCIMDCNSGPNFPPSPADVTSRWMRIRRLNARPRRLGYRKKKRSGPKLVFVQYGFCRESKRHYEQSRAGTRIYIGYALESWRRLQLERSHAGLADGCSYPNGRVFTIESYLLILPYVTLRLKPELSFHVDATQWPRSCLDAVMRPWWFCVGFTCRNAIQCHTGRGRYDFFVKTNDRPRLLWRISSLASAYLFTLF